MAGELGKASLDLEANLGPFEKNVHQAERSADSLNRALDALAAIANVADKQLNDIGMSPGKAAESRASAEMILRGVSGISDKSRIAALELDRVKLSQSQASETEAAGAVIDHQLDNIERKANRTSRALDRVKLGGGRFGRVGLLGAGIGLGVLTTPAAGPAILGLLSAIPVLAGAGAGALGVLALAFSGVGKAIKGDKKAFNELTSSQQQFVLTVRSLDGLSDRLKQIAAQSLFPGLTKGLKAALSPGTVNAVETAIVQLGRALGAAGAQWGRYFGSREFQSIFGPLMQSAAHTIRVLSDAFLHLFDTVGVIARAAIPFTNWLTSAIDKGAKLADQWVHAKDASGQLSKGLDEARTSLTLVWHLLGAIINVIVALGVALYPVAKVAVKLLTDGLNWLAHAIDRNKKTIREIVGGALAALKSSLKILTPIVGALARAANWVAHAIGGWKRVFEIIIGLKFASIIFGWRKGLVALGGLLVKTAIKVGLVSAAEATVGPAAVAAEAEAVPALAAIGAAAEAATALVLPLVAALGAIWVFKNKIGPNIGPGFMGASGFADNSPNFVGPHGKRHPNMAVLFKGMGIGMYVDHDYNLEKGKLSDPSTWSMEDRLWYAETIGLGKGLKIPKSYHGDYGAYYSTHPKALQHVIDTYFKAPSAATGTAHDHHHHRHHHKLKPGTHAWYMKYLGYDPTKMPVFGKQPAWTTNVGSGSSSSSLPQSIVALDALAARQDQQAAALHYAGKKARMHLVKEISDLEQADHLLEEKLKHTHGRRHTQLFAALTANLKKIAEARQRVGDALAKGRQSQLALALDQAKVAAENAQQGSKAWDRAIAAEEHALRAEIRYWDKRAHDMKLTADVRDAALKKELVYEHELKALLTQRAQAVAANEMQFLQAFKAIQNQFAPNSFPMDNQSVGSKKTDTHLYDIKEEARKTNDHLSAIREQGRSSGSPMGLTMAATA